MEDFDRPSADQQNPLLELQQGLDQSLNKQDEQDALRAIKNGTPLEFLTELPENRDYTDRGTDLWSPRRY